MHEIFCDHCGDEVLTKQTYAYQNKVFCCSGCMTVYQLLSDNQLGAFYELENKAGARPQKFQEHKFDFLAVEEISKKLIDFQDENYVKITLFLPEIHCSSCVYLLENLHRILPAVTFCQVSFIKREALITFKKNELSLVDLAKFLSKIGYAPNFGNRAKENKKKEKKFLFKIGLAGFAFGSIMLWSFPEYLGIEDTDVQFRNFTSYLSFFISIPVLLYSASEYFISAFKSIKSQNINLDVPISIGIVALYIQSTYSIFGGNGPGYMDSFAGFVFFLLIGKWFQSRTYKSLSFERDYTSYFPVAVTRLKNNEEEILEIDKINVGDTILIRNEEIIPCDSILESPSAKIDYSFVTGESEPIYKYQGDFIFAGGKLLGQKANFKTEKSANRSLLTQLWDDVKIDKLKPNRFRFQDVLSKYFLGVVLVVAALASIYWLFNDASRIFEIVVAVLIVACPCALALSSPFTYGNVMKLMGKKGLYVKNTSVIEKMDDITDIVFDKTGTLTESVYLNVVQEGDSLTTEEKELLYALVNSSTHPLSRAIVHYLRNQHIRSDFSLENYQEIASAGLSATYQEHSMMLGSHLFVFKDKSVSNETETYYKINEKTGRFVFHSEIRSGMDILIKNLSKNYQIHVLSGDKEKDRILVENLKIKPDHIRFSQTPKDKFDYIDQLQDKGRKVLMVGDGLNDAGALGIAEVGIAVSEDVFRFTPSSDAIIEASRLYELFRLLALSKYAKKVLKICLAFSLVYNIIGLTFAVMGLLTPLVAAIIMPLSSITIVLLSTTLVYTKKV